MFRCLVFIILLIFSRCQDITQPPLYTLLLNQSSAAKVGVVTTDFGANGRLSILNPDSQIASLSPALIHSDAVSRYQDGKVYIINRLNKDTIQTLDTVFFHTEMEFSVGAGSNPHDFIKVNQFKGYVSLYNSPLLLIVNPVTGGVTGSIDLSSFTEKNGSLNGIDGLPEANFMFLYENKLYLQLQRLDRNDISGYFMPKDTSILLEIDIFSDVITGIYTFKAKNPFSKMQFTNLFGEPHLVMAVPDHLGFISRNDGGVEAFNLVTRSFRANFLYAEEVAGGDILDVQIKDDQNGYALVVDASFNKYIHLFNPTTGEKKENLAYYPASTGNFSGLLLSRDGRLYTGDGSTNNPGVSIYDTNRNNIQLTLLPVSVGLRPFDMFVIE